VLTVEALGEIVDQLQRRVVEAPLLGGERLDVPPHEPPEDLLDRIGDEALRAGAPLDRPLGGDGPEALGRRPRPRAKRPLARAGPLDLVPQPVEEHLNIIVLQGFSFLGSHRRIVTRGSYGTVRDLTLYR
jgi:hypothetical protein